MANLYSEFLEPGAPDELIQDGASNSSCRCQEIGPPGDSKLMGCLDLL